MSNAAYSAFGSQVSVTVAGVGSYLPEQRVSNRQMLERVDPRHPDGTPFGADWIERHVGINERRLDFDFEAGRKRERSEGGLFGLVVTKTLVVLGDPQVTTTPEHPRGAMLRAYDKQTGREVGAVWMPAPQSGSPMTYKGQDGRQYIVIAISGGNYSGEYLAFALPASEMRPTAQQ